MLITVICDGRGILHKENYLLQYLLIEKLNFLQTRLAQLVEHRSYEPKVVGSTPTSSIWSLVRYENCYVNPTTLNGSPKYDLKLFYIAITGVSSPNCGDKVEVQFLFMATLWG